MRAGFESLHYFKCPVTRNCQNGHLESVGFEVAPHLGIG